MGKPVLRVGLLAWATSCGGLGYAVAANKREVPDVDHYVEKSILLLSRIRVYYHDIYIYIYSHPHNAGDGHAGFYGTGKHCLCIKRGAP